MDNSFGVWGLGNGQEHGTLSLGILYGFSEI